MHPRMMGTMTEGSGSESKLDANAAEHYIVMPGQRHSIEDDINRLFETIDIKTTRDTLRKSAMKRPIRAGSSPASGIGISEPVSLKQALRGLCISQASEMAAMKRLSKPARLSGASEAGTIKRLYRAVVVETSEYGHPHYEDKGNMVEISLVPERGTLNVSGKIPEVQHISEMEQSNQSAVPSTLLDGASAQRAKMSKTLTQDDEFAPLPPNANCGSPKAGLKQNMKMKSICPSFGSHTSNKLPVLAEIVSASVEDPVRPAGLDIELKGNLHYASSPSSFGYESNSNKSASTGPRFIKSVSKSKTLVKKKVLHKFAPSSTQCNGDQKDLGSPSKIVCQDSDCALTNGSKEKGSASLASISINVSSEVISSSMNSSASKAGFTSNCSNKATNVVRADEQSRSREKGEFSQSSKSSIGEYSSSTSFSEESHLSGSSHNGYRPHMSKDVRWEAIRCVQKQHSSLGLRHFKLLRKLGAGDIASVYLAELTGTSCLFALKVMDNELLASRKKLPRAQTEREILQMLDHPFLPTLFAHFTADKYSCLVMEHCPGGDLHVLRQKQPSKSFSEQAARFYVSEVLLALEYLHMLGVVYRDLKPENILVREDGHIMLSDFDLSLRCAANSTLLKSSSPIDEPPKKVSSPCSESSCIEPFCLHPSWQVPCFTPRFLSAAAKARKLKSDLAAQVSPLPQLVVEPTTARSNSFVGTHEYLAPEIIKGEGHGSSVDWWTFGIFIYELLYGRTPFKGAGNEDTLTNVVSQCLKFPESPIISSHARDLIRRLLKKEPENRLGSIKGAAEIKHHPFFEGMNWPLIRCATPPELPKLSEFGIITSDMMSQNKESTKCRKECKNTEEDPEFEMF